MTQPFNKTINNNNKNVNYGCTGCYNNRDIFESYVILTLTAVSSITTPRNKGSRFTMDFYLRYLG